MHQIGTGYAPDGTLEELEEQPVNRIHAPAEE